ncbi:MAG: SPOR domain-containing protein [Alphaproteobacteria bacterium]|nr:SPOR domain-containing protein [Alphaproteobacteria bacterium]
MSSAIGRDKSRLSLAGIGVLPATLVTVALLTVGCAEKSPLEFLKPKPATSKGASATKQASTVAPAIKPTAKPVPVKSETEKSSGAPKNAEPKKSGSLSAEQLATAPLKPSDRLGPGFWIQLAVHFKAKGGEAAWKTLSSKHRGLLSGESHAIKRVDLGKQGRFYRVLAGPYATRGPAQEKCDRLKRAKVACFLITQRGRVRGTPKARASKSVAPKPPATEIPAAAVKPRNKSAPRKAAITATPAFVKPAPKPRGKAAEKKTGTPAVKKKRAADLPFQRSDSIPDVTK